MSENTSNLVIFFVLSIIILLFLLTSYKKITQWICFNNTFLCVKSKLQLAVECSYYRCKEGCKSDIIGKLKKNDFSCEDFCLEEWQDNEGKICGDNSFYHPIILQNIKKYEYTEDDFNAKCVLKIDKYRNTKFDDFIEYAKTLNEKDKNFIYIENSLLDKDKTKIVDRFCFNKILPVSFSRLKKINFKEENRQYFIFTKNFKIKNIFGNSYYSTNTFILENICESCPDKECCQKLIDYGINCFIINNECYYAEADCDDCGVNKECCQKLMEKGKNCIYSGLMCYNKEELDNKYKNKKECFECYNDEECCNYLSINKKSLCFYNPYDNSCLKENQIICDEYSSLYGLNDICFYSADYFCNIENKDLVASGCYNSYCYKICGSLVDIKSYIEEGNTFQSYFSDYKDCIFAVNVFNQKYNSNIDYKVCCEMVKSCNNYTSQNLCNNNNCAIGNCVWNDNAKRCEDWNQ